MSATDSVPTVSVIIAAYNAARTLPDTVNSILAQTMQDFEVLIIDDCSKDNTIEVARKLADGDTRIRVLQAQTNGGPGAARNIGFDEAKGKWIAIVDSDDTIQPERLEKMLSGGSDATIIFDNLYFEEEEGRRNYVPLDAECFGVLQLDVFIRSHRREYKIPNLGFLKPLLLRDSLEKHKLRYDPKLKIGEDAFLIMQLMALGEKAVLLPQAYYKYERRMGSISSIQQSGNVRAITDSYYKLSKDYDLSPVAVKWLKALIHDNESRLAAMDIFKEMPSAHALTSLIKFAFLKYDPRILAIETGVYLRYRKK